MSVSSSCCSFFLFYLFTLLSTLHLSAQSNDIALVKKSYETVSIPSDQAPVIDGLLNDAAWEAAEWEGDFIEREPEEGTAPSQDTRFKIIYDAKNLYLGIRCFDDEPEKIVRRLSRRDGFEGDWVEVNIDSYHDLQSAFSFTVTAAGVKGDEFVSANGNNWDESWNPIWYTKSNIDEKGWTAEMKIPLTQLRFGKSENQTWGLQMQRRFFRNEERFVWQRVPQDASGWVSLFGELNGLKDIKPQRQIELQPYVVASQESYPKDGDNPFRTGSDSKFSAGLDGKVGITNDLTLDFTINPDFGQVEADPAAITLDGFQIFFQEQRPFFVENKNIFNYAVSRSEAGNTFGNDNLFYSRRIGKSPSHYPDINDEDYIDQPQNTTILGAAKFSGKTKDGWSIGLLESVTQKEYATIDNGDTQVEELVEPLSNYLVTRLKKDFNDRNSFVGGILTSTNRQLEGNLDFLHKSATTAGLDFQHQWKERSWSLEGNIVLSHVRGSQEAILNTQESITHLFQREDAEHLSVDTSKTSLTGTGGSIKIGKFGNGNFIFQSGFTWRSPELELNDIGFQRLSDDLRHFHWMGYRWRKPFSIFRNLAVNYNHWLVFDHSGKNNSVAWNINSFGVFKNNWRGGLGTNITPIKYSNAELRGGPRFRYVPQMGGWIWLATDNRKKIQLNVNYFTDRAKDRASGIDGFNFNVRYQPINALSVSVGPNVNKSYNQLQYVDQKDFQNRSEYLVASIERNTFGMSIRLNLTINPNLTLQYYGQPYITKVNYSNFKRIINPTSKTLSEKFDLFTADEITHNSDTDEYLIDQNSDGINDYSLGNPDFAYTQYRSNLVLRWEYTPGSELYFVWSQNNSGNGDPMERLSGIFNNEIIGNPSEHILLIKATYRLAL